MSALILVSVTVYRTPPGQPWTPDLRGEFAGIGSLLRWSTVPGALRALASLEPVYGVCVAREVDAQGRHTLTFHQIARGVVTVLAEGGRPLR